MLRGLRGRLSHALRFLLLLVPREAGEVNDLLSGLFRALRCARMASSGPRQAVQRFPS
jgi:hypothetical protein